jgi:hypothetical protein
MREILYISTASRSCSIGLTDQGNETPPRRCSRHPKRDSQCHRPDIHQSHVRADTLIDNMYSLVPADHALLRPGCPGSSTMRSRLLAHKILPLWVSPHLFPTFHFDVGNFDYSPRPRASVAYSPPTLVHCPSWIRHLAYPPCWEAVCKTSPVLACVSEVGRRMCIPDLFSCNCCMLRPG